jgi:hypothetical protein
MVDTNSGDWIVVCPVCGAEAIATVTDQVNGFRVERSQTEITCPSGCDHTEDQVDAVFAEIEDSVDKWRGW